MTKYNVRPLVAQENEISTGTIISATLDNLINNHYGKLI